MLYSVTLPEYGATSIRYPRGNSEGLDWRKEFQKIPIGKANLLQEGNDIAILTIGTIGNRAKEAIKMAEKEGISILHYDMRFLKPIDTTAILHACKSCKTIITIEDGTIIGGLNSAVSQFIATENINIPVVALGIPDKFIEQGSIAELMTECHYNRDDIYLKIIQLHNKVNGL